MIDLAGMFEAACGAVTVVTVSSLWFCDRISKREAALDETDKKEQSKPDPEALRTAISKKRDIWIQRRAEWRKEYERKFDANPWKGAWKCDQMLAELADEEAKIPSPSSVK